MEVGLLKNEPEMVDSSQIGTPDQLEQCPVGCFGIHCTRLQRDRTESDYGDFSVTVDQDK